MEEKYISTIKIMEGNFITFKQDKVLLSNGNEASRDCVIHPGAVAVVPITSSKEIIMVKQYRYPVGEVLYEIPAGKLDKGEDPLVCGRRELEEETGHKAKNWEKIMTFYTAPGFADEKMHLYLASDLEEASACPDPDEIIEYEKIPWDKAFNMLKEGAIKDVKTIVSLLYIQNNLKK